MAQNILSDRQLESWNSSARTHRTLTVFYLAALGFVGIIVEGTTHEQLLNPDIKIALPVLGSSLPVLSFYVFAPIFIILLHIQLLLQVSQLAESFFNFNKKLTFKNLNSKIDPQEEWKNQVLPTLTTTVLLQPPKTNRVTLLIMRFMAFIFYWCLTPFILVRMQLKFLPYHSNGITLSHQLSLSLSLILIAVFYCIIWKYTNQKKIEFKNFTILLQIAFFWIVYLLSEHDLPLSLTLVAAFCYIVWKRINEKRAAFKNLEVFLQLSFFLIAYTLIPLFCWTVLKIPDNNEECLPKIFGIVAENILEMPTQKKGCVNIGTLIDRNLILTSKKLALRPEAEIRDDFIHKDNRDKRLELYEALNLTNRDLRFANFEEADLTKADFRGSKLDNAKFSRAKLENSKWNPYKNPDESLNKTSAKNADMELANLQGADMELANLQGAEMVSANLKGANMKRANLKGAEMKRANLQGAYMMEANLQGAYMMEANLQGADMMEANLEGANMIEANLQGADMESANLKGAEMKRANLQGAYMMEANLQGAYMKYAHLEGANMYRAKLEGANMIEANLQGAYMYRAKLEGANMIEANLQGAYMIEAKVNFTNFNNSYLEKLNFTEDELLKWAKEIPEKRVRYFDTRFPRKEFLMRMRGRKNIETILPDLSGDNAKFCHSGQKQFKGIKSFSEKECKVERKKIIAELKGKWKTEKDKEKSAQ
jgi:uncharacterized protein YjbI with pentapeptide repeats